MPDGAWFVVGFLIAGLPGLIALVKFMERFDWMNMRLDEQQEQLSQVGVQVTDANERLWGRDMLIYSEEKLRELGLSDRQPQPSKRNPRKWEL